MSQLGTLFSDFFSLEAGTKPVHTHSDMWREGKVAFKRYSPGEPWASGVGPDSTRLVA